MRAARGLTVHEEIDLATAAQDGFGLGLAIADSMAAIHRATIDARPKADGGLAVTSSSRPRPRRPSARDDH